MYIKHIEKIINIDELKIKSILIENNIKLRKRKPSNKLDLDGEHINKIINLYKIDNKSIRNISTIMKISYEVVRRILLENNIKMRDNTGSKSVEHRKKLSDVRKGKYVGNKNPMYINISNEIKNRIIELRKSGVSINNIGKIVGLKYGKLYNYMKYNGILNENKRNS